jgi:Zn-dependent peptidase ImmA (M78 family)
MEQGLPIREVAAELRIKAGQSRPAYSTRAIIDKCFPGTLVTGRVLPQGILEIVSRTSEGPVIIYSRHLAGPRQRYAIAHAMAHLLFDSADSACRPQFTGESAVEERADRFADELLVPLACLKPLVTRHPPLRPDGPDHELYLDAVDEISSVFHVPSYVIDRRIRLLISLGEIS